MSVDLRDVVHFWIYLLNWKSFGHDKQHNDSVILKLLEVLHSLSFVPDSRHWLNNLVFRKNKGVPPLKKNNFWNCNL